MGFDRMRGWVAGCMFLWAGVASAQEITLNTDDASSTLRGQLRTASLVMGLRNEADATAQDFVAAARADYRRLLTVFYAAGYYGPDISIRVNGVEASNIAPLDAPSDVRSIEISTTSGLAFRFGEATIAPIPDETALPERFAVGERAASSTVRDAVSAGISSWREIGHAKAEVSGQSLSADHRTSTLAANITLAPGPRLTFGNVTIEGNKDVRTRAIRRIAGIPEGDVFSPDELAAATQRLRRTGAFDTANATEAENIGAGDTLPIALTVSESKPRRFGFGLELSTIDGLTVSSFWMHRNAFGGAERFRVDGEISGIGGETGGVDYSLTSSLAIPAVYGPNTDFLATFGLSREDEPTYKIDKISTEAQLTREIADDVTANVGIGLLRAREETEDGVRLYTLLTLPVGVELDKRDNATSTTEGYYLDLDVTPFLGLQGVDNGAQVFADARGFATVGEERPLTFAARFMVGSLLGAAPADAPADFLFFSGGGGTVRGQAYKTLGIDDDGTLRGGASFAGAQLETRLGVTDDIGVVGFYDFGYVGDTPTPLQDGEWHAGAGIGIRYNTGIGPIRLDVGTPASGDDAFDAVQVYIGIGQAF